MVSLSLAMLLLCAAVSGLLVLHPVLGYLQLVSNPMLSATAGAVTLLALPTAYFTGVILVYMQIAPAAPPALVSPAALRMFAAMACALLLLFAIIMPLVL